MFFAPSYRPSEAATRTTPHPSFHYRVSLVAFATDTGVSVRGGAHPAIMGALAEMPEAGGIQVRGTATSWCESGHAVVEGLSVS